MGVTTVALIDTDSDPDTVDWRFQAMTTASLDRVDSRQARRCDFGREGLVPPPPEPQATARADEPASAAERRRRREP